MEFTKEQRHEVYKRARRDMEGYTVCARVQYAANVVTGEHPFLIEIPKLFPELKPFKPAKSGPYALWWPEGDQKSRNSCLDTCIELTKPSTSSHEPK